MYRNDKLRNQNLQKKLDIRKLLVLTTYTKLDLEAEQGPVLNAKRRVIANLIQMKQVRMKFRQQRGLIIKR